jgi:hypothetical protein
MSGIWTTNICSLGFWDIRECVILWSLILRSLGYIRATPHTSMRAHDHYTSSTLIGWKGQSRSRFTSHYTWGTNGVCECKMDVKFVWIPPWHHMDHVFMVTWIIFKNHHLEVGLDGRTWDHGTLDVHNHWFILFYHVWGSALIEIHQNSIWSRTSHVWLHIALEGPWPHYMILEVPWDNLGTTFGHSLLGSHNFMVIALGSCVKWPLASPTHGGKVPTFESQETI